MVEIRNSWQQVKYAKLHISWPMRGTIISASIYPTAGTQTTTKKSQSPMKWLKQNRSRPVRKITLLIGNVQWFATCLFSCHFLYYRFVGSQATICMPPIDQYRLVGSPATICMPPIDQCRLAGSPATICMPPMDQYRLAGSPATICMPPIDQ